MMCEYIHTPRCIARRPSGSRKSMGRRAEAVLLLLLCGSCVATMLIHESVSHVLMEYSFSHFLGLKIIMIAKLANVLHELIHLKRIHFKKRHGRNTLLDGSLEVIQRILGNELLLQDLVRILEKIYP